MNQKKVHPKDSYIELLKTDFAQQNEWMRHYDERFMSIINFLNAGYVSIAVAVYVLCYKFENKFVGSLGATMLLLFTSLVGIILLFSLIRNRVYFTTVTRYVNEIRSAYLQGKPLGVVNQVKMYADPLKPNFFFPYSTHSLLMYFVCLCNSAIIATTLCFVLRTIYIYKCREFQIPLVWVTTTAGCALLLQVVFMIKYLRSYEILRPPKADSE